MWPLKGMMEISLLLLCALLCEESELEHIDFLRYQQLSTGCASRLGYV